jgi:glycosyltransferase involved in cell wall biosynthesis
VDKGWTTETLLKEDRPKVALFSTHFGVYSQTFVYDEVRLHSRYDVEVFARDRSNPDTFPFEPVHTVEGKWATTRYGLTTYNRSYMDRMKQGQFNLLHAHFGPGSIYALPYQKATGLPLVVTYHGYDVPLLMTPRRFKPKYWRYWLWSKARFADSTGRAGRPGQSMAPGCQHSRVGWGTETGWKTGDHGGPLHREKGTR